MAKRKKWAEPISRADTFGRRTGHSQECHSCGATFQSKRCPFCPKQFSKRKDEIEAEGMVNGNVASSDVWRYMKGE